MQATEQEAKRPRYDEDDRHLHNEQLQIRHVRERVNPSWGCPINPSGEPLVHPRDCSPG